MPKGFAYEVELGLEALGTMCMLFSPFGSVAASMILSPPFAWWKIIWGAIAVALSIAMLRLSFAIWELAERMGKKRISNNPVS